MGLQKITGYQILKLGWICLGEKKKKPTYFTETHRITELLRLEAALEMVSSKEKWAQVVRRFVPLGFDCPQGWRLQITWVSPGNLELKHPLQKNIFFYFFKRGFSYV